ncbi:HAMP domain-containing protein [Rhizobium lentis]|uniref:HAMP domain-containing protein n=1 Tax=Rhizobium lentis TaxID=1138194 RepID=UPI0021809EDD|nr:HAMP domain-containing protein [Rhizobium lentis]
MATKAEEEADASAAFVLYVNRLLTIITLIGAAVFGARVIAKPIGEIIASMSGLAEGNLDAVIPFANRRDEIGRMARAV